MADGATVPERVEQLRRELADLAGLLARLPDPPEPLTAGELAARATDRGFGRDAGHRMGRVPPPPPHSVPGSLAAAAAALRAGELSAAELVGEALDRAEAARSLGAFLRLRPEALEEARRADAPAARAAAGPLRGIPLGVKDIVDVAGMTTTSGSRFPREAARSAPCWQALADAGAILIGKNNLQEFAFGVTGDNPTFGRVGNPRDPARITGGSSSGSAAAVAAGLGLGSIGTDTGGSIRIPAALTGVFGLKPSYGRISRAGVTPLSWSLDHLGPLARSARDIGILWEVLSGEEPDDPPARPPDGTPDSLPLAGVRVGAPRDFFHADLTREARRAAEGVTEALAGLGAGTVELRIPEAELSGASRNALAFAEAAAFHRERLARRPDDFSPEVRTLLEVGGGLSAGDLITALAGRRLVTDAFSRLFGQVDALVVPTTPAGAPRAGEPLLATGEAIRPGLIRLVGPFNLTGLPALTVPAGSDAHGMPLGVQLVGAPGAERTVIRLARFLEADGRTRAVPTGIPAAAERPSPDNGGDLPPLPTRRMD